MILNHKKGFTILELMIAIFILLVGIGSAFSLISQTVTHTSLLKKKLIASYLAQEGIELIRNIRDGNYLKEENWDQWLTDCSNGCIVDYQSLPNQPLTPYDNQYLKIDNESFFFNYSRGSSTKFKRKITTQKKDSDTLDVVCEVFWEERGRNYSFKVIDQLKNWKP
jgi:prepilin-type N-terminal cleavage/methylation domain-containing protein